MQTKTLLRKLTLLLMTGLLAFSGMNCALLGLEDEDDDENTNLLALFGLIALANSGSTCEDNSGLVICIPPGLRR